MKRRHSLLAFLSLVSRQLTSSATMMRRKPILATSGAAAIILCAQTGTSVAQQVVNVGVENRHLVVVVSDLSDGYKDMPEAVYNFIEAQAQALALNTLTRHYAQVFNVRRPGLTIEDFVTALDRAAQPGKSVDLIFVTHGLNDRIVFSTSERTTAPELAQRILQQLDPGQRASLRAVFSTACFGREHLDDWLNAGFKVASGANQIYADSAASYQPFLNQWASGQSFLRAVEAANGADHPLRFWDNAARAYYAAQNMDKEARSVDSIRSVSGARNLRINTMVSQAPRDPRAVMPRDPRAAMRDRLEAAPPVETTLIGGTGGRPSQIDCQSGQRIVGVHGRAGSFVDRIGPVCQRLDNGRRVGNLVRRPTAGGNGGRPFTLSCAAGHVVVGVRVRSGLFLDQIRLQCALPTDRRVIRRTTAAGGTGGSPGAVNCPSPRFAMGLNLRTGQFVDRVGLRCR